MNSYSYRLWFMFLAIVTVGACAAIDEPEQMTGFLSDYSKLERDTDDRWLYSAANTGSYSKFYIEPVSILFEPREEPSFSPDQIEQLKTYMIVRLTERLTEDDGYEVVSEPGPGVAIFRIGITDVDASIAALNISIYTKITGAGLGGIAAEGEIVDVDSVTGEQLAAAIRWGGGSRVLRAGLTKLGDAKIVIDRWARDIRERIDAAHDRAG
jgi:hypothetical protein